MAGNLSLWGAGQMLKSFISKSATPPGSFYLALIGEIPPSTYMSGSEIDEPSAPSYQRAEIVNDIGYWAEDVQPQLMVTRNTVAYLPAVEDWGVIRYWALCDSPFGGSVYFVGKLEVAQTINAGDTAQIGAGDLAVQLGPFFGTEN